MSTIQTLKTRPWLAAAAALTVMVVLLGIVPIPYEKTTAHDVSLTVSGIGIDPGHIGQVAKSLKSALGAERVSVSAVDQGGSPAFTFSTTVGGRAGNRADAVAQAFAKGLNARGYTASAVTTPRRERVWGPVVAYAVDRVISISVDGKTAAQLEQEIRQRLAEAGVTDASVSVTDGPNGTQKVGIEVKREQDSTQPTVPMPELQLTKDGAPLDSKGTALDVRKLKGPDGTTLSLTVHNKGQVATANIAHTETMSDAQLAAAVKAELAKAGLDLQVTVTDGRVEIQPPAH